MRPALLARHRRPAALGLGFLALVQAAIAAAFASQIGTTVAGGAGNGTIVMLIAIAIAAGTAMAMERWVAEHFAQSYVSDCRAALFASVVRHQGRGGDARWLSGLVGDMAAIRNFAVRGSVKLVTTALSGGLALIWLLLAHPTMALAGLPLLVALALLVPAARRLSSAIADQRRERGRLNRFLIRRVRIALSGEPTPKGHGKRKLTLLSAELSKEAVGRARWVGMMEAIAIIAGMASSIILVSATPAPDNGSLIAGFAIIGFASARLLDGARALHARIGGMVSLHRLDRLLARPGTADSAQDKDSDHD